MRAFIAVPIGNAVKKKVSAFSEALELEGVTVVPEKNMHVTLFFLGETDERRAGEVTRALEKISVPPFKMKFKGAGVFPNPNFIRVAWVGLEAPELEKIFRELSPDILRMGYKPEPFHAHLTVARVKTPEAKEKVREAVKRFQGKDFGSSTAQRVVLFESKLSPKGPSYGEVYSKKLCRA